MDFSPPPASLIETPDAESLGAVLAGLRIEQGISQRELLSRAAKLGKSDIGLTLSAATHWERDLRVPRPGHLMVLLQVLIPDMRAPEGGAVLLRVLGAAARQDPLYVPGLTLCQQGEWGWEEWARWALTFPRRAGRGGR